VRASKHESRVDVAEAELRLGADRVGRARVADDDGGEEQACADPLRNDGPHQFATSQQVVVMPVDGLKPPFVQ
jgi:hypothetical protein